MKDVIILAFEYEKLLVLLLPCFGNREGTISFCKNMSKMIMTPKLQEITAYRYLILSCSTEDEGYEGWKKAQVDHKRLREPYSSWSKTLTGAEYYINKHKENSHFVLIEGKIQGFDLIQFTQEVIDALSLFLKEHKDELQEYGKSIENTKIYDSLSGYAFVLNQNRSRYHQEDEFVSTSVIDYNVLKSYTKNFDL